MSAEEESFIVLDDTPSMHQFSLLDSSISESEVILGNNSLFATNIDNERRNQDSLDVFFEAPSKRNGNLQPATDNLPSVSMKEEGNTPTNNHLSNCLVPPNATLAQSFLLGDINCDKMKVNNHCII